MATNDRFRPVRLGFIDEIRSFSIIIVFLFHCVVESCARDQLSWNGMLRSFDASPTFCLLLPFTMGWAGVASFFVVSGFCIRLATREVELEGWRSFFGRRLFRIYPAYLVALLFFGVFFRWSKVNLESCEGWRQMFLHAGLIHNWYADSILKISPSFWSIAVEAQLYALYPLLFVLVKRKGWKIALVTTAIIEVTIRTSAALEITFSQVAVLAPAVLYCGPWSYWFSWAIGAHVADRWTDGRIRGDSKRIILYLASSLLFWNIKPLIMFSFPAFALFTSELIALMLAKQATTFVGNLWRGHIVFVGTISYSIYLSHHRLLRGVPRILEAFNEGRLPSQMVVFVSCVVAWIPIFGISYLLYRFVEVPGARLGRYIWRNSPKNEMTGRPPRMSSVASLIRNPSEVRERT